MLINRQYIYGILFTSDGILDLICELSRRFVFEFHVSVFENMCANAVSAISRNSHRSTQPLDFLDLYYLNLHYGINRICIL